MKASNQTRVQVRTTKDEKIFLEKAAHKCGFKTLSEFIRVSAYEKARRELRELPEANIKMYETPTEPTRLSAADSAFLVESLLNTKEPNALLKALFLKSNEELLKELLTSRKK